MKRAENVLQGLPELLVVVSSKRQDTARNTGRPGNRHKLCAKLRIEFSQEVKSMPVQHTGVRLFEEHRQRRLRGLFYLFDGREKMSRILEALLHEECFEPGGDHGSVLPP